MEWINIFHKGMNIYLVFCDVLYYLSKIVLTLAIHAIHEGRHTAKKKYTTRVSMLFYFFSAFVATILKNNPLE